MRQILLGILVVAITLSVATYMVWPRPPLVEQRAMAAYGETDYARALPLLKEWAALPEVLHNEKKLAQVIGMIQIADRRLKKSQAGAAVENAEPARSPGTTKPASRPADAIAAATQALTANTTFAERLQEIRNRPVDADPAMGANRVPHVVPKAGEVPMMKIKELGNFEFNPDKDTQVPADVAALNGKTIRLTGYMIPLTQAEEVTDFALVPSLVSCCFGQPPGVQHTITGRTAKGKAIPYVIDELIVEGTLTVKVQREDDYTFSVFELDVKSVKILPQK